MSVVFPQKPLLLKRKYTLEIPTVSKSKLFETGQAETDFFESKRKKNNLSDYGKESSRDFKKFTGDFVENMADFWWNRVNLRKKKLIR